MASEKISAMPALGGNQVPTDLVPLVDLSAAPANQNVKSTLNDLFAFLTKNVTDRAVRFDAPGSTPALSAAGAGAIYFNGSRFQVSESTGAWVSLVVAGLISGSGLTQNTARILGRTTAGVGAVEEITVGANLALSAGSLAVTGVALSGLVTSSGLTQNTARILGRTTAGAGAIEEISVGANLALSAGSLAVTGVALSGLISGSGLTQNTARILGRTTAGAGAIEEISVGANLALSAGSLAVTGVALSGLVTSSGLTQNTARLLGRTTAGVGAVEEISIGPGLTLTGGVLDATGGGGGTPGGSQYDVQFHDSGGTFGGSNNFQFKPSGNPTVSIRATSASHSVLDLTADAAQTAEVVLIKQDGDNAASLLTLRQGTLSTLISSFPFRYENASGTLLLGLRSRPATGLYQFVSPGATNGQVVYEVNALGSNNGLGTASVAGYPAIFAGGIQCVWFNGANGYTVFNRAYQVVWGGFPNSYTSGLSEVVSGVLRVTNAGAGQGRLLIGTSTDLIGGNLGVFATSGTGSGPTLISRFGANASVTPNNGFGGEIEFQAQTSVQMRTAGNFDWYWSNATDASRSSEFLFQTVSSGSLVNSLYVSPSGITLGKAPSLTGSAIEAERTYSNPVTVQTNSLINTVTNITNSTSVIVSAFNNSVFMNAGASNISDVRALQNFVGHNGSGTVSNAYAANTVCRNAGAGIITNAFGAQYRVDIIGTGSITTATGIICAIVRSNGSIGTAIGFRANMTTASTSTNYGMQIDINSPSSISHGVLVNSITAGTAYGVYIASITAANAYGVYVNGPYLNVSFGGSTTWSTVSDQRFKRDIVDYERGLETVLQLRPRRFTWNELSTCPGKRAVGLIAQEAQIVDFELVSEITTDKTSMLVVDVANITHMLINSTKTLHQRITALEEKIHA